MKNEKEIILNLKESEYKNYSYVKSADKLVLYIIDLLEQKDIEPRFDHIAIAAFKVFPKVFSLPLYSEYPDVLRVDHCILHCSYGHKWLDGSVKQGFKLNSLGKKILEGFQDELLNEPSKRIAQNSEKRIVRRKEKAIIDKIIRTKAYSYFLNDKLDSIDIDYLKEALRCTPSASKEIIRNNYEKIWKYAQEITAEPKFFEFLEKIKKILEIK